MYQVFLLNCFGIQPMRYSIIAERSIVKKPMNIEMSFRTIDRKTIIHMEHH